LLIRQVWGDVLVLVLLIGGGALLTTMAIAPLHHTASYTVMTSTLLTPRSHMYGEEYFPDGRAYRWTKGGESLWQLPNPGGSPIVRLTLAGGPGRTVPVTVRYNQAPTTYAFLIAPEPRQYSLLAPATPTERVALWLASPTIDDPKHGHSLGIVISDMQVENSGSGGVPRGLTTGLLWAIVGGFLVLRLAGLRRVYATLLIVVSFGAIVAWYGYGGGWQYGLAGTLLLTSGLVLIAAWGVGVLVGRESTADQHPLMLLVISSGIVFLPIMLVQVAIAGDYPVHIGEAVRMSREGTIGFPHFLYQVLVLVLHTVAPATFYQSSLGLIYGLVPHIPAQFPATYEVVSGYEIPGVLAVVVWYLIASIVVYRFLQGKDKPLHRRERFVLAGVTLAVLLATAISLLSWLGVDPLRYLGYIGFQAYHNPTIHGIKPIALLLFWFALAMFPSISITSDQRGSLLWHTAATAALTILSALAKPNYSICLVPALMLLAGYRFIRKQPVHWLVLAFGVVIPGGLVLVWQYAITYAAQGPVMESSSIVFAPFAVMSAYSGWLPVKFLLSILFPLAVVLLYFPTAKQSVPLQVAWLTFAGGLFFTYFLSESGDRMLHGNFVWSAQIALFVLFVTSVHFLIQQHDYLTIAPKRFLQDKRYTVCVLLFGLHTLSGIVYYSQSLSDTVW
jgi:hypothetical protein